MSRFHKKEREHNNADLFFASLIQRFHQALFGVDHDDPKTPKVNVFEIFNKAWISYCEEHNKKAKKVAVDPEAFYNYAIKQD
jgi:hypothetical protein